MKEQLKNKLYLASVLAVNYAKHVYQAKLGDKTLNQRLGDGILSVFTVGSISIIGAAVAALTVIALYCLGAEISDIAHLTTALSYLAGIGVTALVIAVAFAFKYLAMFILSQYWEDSLRSFVSTKLGLL